MFQNFVNLTLIKIPFITNITLFSQIIQEPDQLSFNKIVKKTNRSVIKRL